MNSSNSDEELGKLLRITAASVGYSPESFMDIGAAAITRLRWSVMPNFPPYPSIELDETLREEHFDSWPEWSAKLISPGCKIQQMTWLDGTITTRLVSRQRAVLAAEIERPSLPKNT